MLAYACSPYRGSEPGVGWQRAVEMAKHFDVCVITEELEFRGDIERFLRENVPVRHLHFRFVPRIIAADRTWRALSRFRPLYYFFYNLWHKRAYRLARQLWREVQFDLVHQSTMCGFREPGRLWMLDAPFIWGPVGGTQNYPWRFLLEAGFAEMLKEGVRSIVNFFQLRLSRRVRQASKRACVLLTANPSGQRDFKRAHGVDTVSMLDVGVSCVIDKPRKYIGRRSPLRLLWSGSLEYRKALQLLLKALAQLPEDVGYELRILGNGPLQKTWRTQAERLGVASHCMWLGWLPHDVAMQHNAWADVFVFTSLRDTCGTVVLEALSHGLPVICLDHQGVGSVVTQQCGIKIPVTSPHEVVKNLRDAIVLASNDHIRMEELSRGAIKRAREYLWQHHGEQLAELYRDAFSNCSAVKRERPVDKA